jgi:hypothetical protein
MDIPIVDSKKITNIEINNIDVSFIYNTNNCKDAALLRKKIMTQIQCYTIDQVTYQAIPNLFTPEKLALRFGLLIPIFDENVNGYIDIKGPKLVTCEDVTGIKFVHNMPIIYLDEDDTLKCTLTMKKDCGATHAKWNPVSNIRFQQHDKGFIFNLELTGLLSFDEILNQL